VLASLLKGEKSRRQETEWPFIIISALLLFLAAFGPFFILRDSFLSLRSLFFCVPVFALLVQWAWDKLAGFRVFTPIAGFVITVFMLLNIGAVNAFRVNYQDDNHVAEQITDILYDNGHPSDFRKVWLFGARYQFTRHGGVHLHSATLSDWSLAVLVNAKEYEKFGKRYSVPEGGYLFNPVVQGWYYENGIDPDCDLFLAADEQARVFPLRLEGNLLTVAATGERYGELLREGEAFRFGK
jgi:hypothetical protein